jgi:hypothetical protein
MGDRKTRGNAGRRRVPRLARFDRERWQDQCLGIRGEALCGVVLRVCVAGFDQLNLRNHLILQTRVLPNIS